MKINGIYEVSTKTEKEYNLDQHVGFLLRKAAQRNSEIFSGLMFPELTPTRFAALAKLYEVGAISQNELGRRTAMDVATIKGVVGRLGNLGLVTICKDPNDRRKHLVQLTAAGEKMVKKAMETAFTVTEKTLQPLTNSEKRTLVNLIKKIC